MKVYVHGILIALMTSYAYGFTSNGEKKEQEIGEATIILIKQKLKERFLTLLASSEFSSVKIFERRIKDVEDGLQSFKAEFDELMKKNQSPITPKPTVSSLSLPETPVAAPVQTSQPAVQPAPEVKPAEVVPAPAPISAPEKPPTPPGIPPATVSPAMSETPATLPAPSEQPLPTPAPTLPVASPATPEIVSPF